MLSQKVKSTVLDAASKLTGAKKRAFMAKVAEDYFNGSARMVETYLGWSRATVEKGQKELQTGLVCVDNYRAKGRKKTEQKWANLEADLRSLMDNHSQADPQLKSTFCYARISARSVREALIQEKGYPDSELPCRQTLGDVLNRMGYRLKKHKKVNL